MIYYIYIYFLFLDGHNIALQSHWCTSILYHFVATFRPCWHSKFVLGAEVHQARYESWQLYTPSALSWLFDFPWSREFEPRSVVGLKRAICKKLKRGPPLPQQWMHCGCTRTLVSFDIKQIQAGHWIRLTRASCHGIFAKVSFAEWLAEPKPEIQARKCRPLRPKRLYFGGRSSICIGSGAKHAEIEMIKVLVVCQARKVRFDKHIRALIQLQREMKPERRSCTASAYPWEHRERWSLRQGVEDSSRPVFEALKLLFQAAWAWHAWHA